MLADTITPDGYYVNAKGEKTGYIPGWLQEDVYKRQGTVRCKAKTPAEEHTKL